MTNRIVRADDPVITADEIVMRRAENQTKTAKVNKFLDQYGKLIMALLVAVGGWFVSDVVEPLKSIPAVVAKQVAQDSVNNEIMLKLDNADRDRVQMAEILAALAALQCEQSTPREKLTSQLCRKLTIGD